MHVFISATDRWVFEEKERLKQNEDEADEETPTVCRRTLWSFGIQPKFNLQNYVDDITDCKYWKTYLNYVSLPTNAHETFR